MKIPRDTRSLHFVWKASSLKHFFRACANVLCSRNSLHQHHHISPPQNRQYLNYFLIQFFFSFSMCCMSIFGNPLYLIRQCDQKSKPKKGVTGIRAITSHSYSLICRSLRASTAGQPANRSWAPSRPRVSIAIDIVHYPVRYRVTLKKHPSTFLVITWQ